MRGTSLFRRCNIFNLMGKIKATNFLRLIAFGIVTILFQSQDAFDYQIISSPFTSNLEGCGDTLKLSATYFFNSLISVSFSMVISAVKISLLFGP